MPFSVSFLEAVELIACAINDAYENGGLVSLDEYSEESNGSAGTEDSFFTVARSLPDLVAVPLDAPLFEASADVSFSSLGSKNVKETSPIWILVLFSNGTVTPFSTNSSFTKAPFLPNTIISNLWVVKL